MANLPRKQVTIHQTMVLIAIAGVFLWLISAYREHLDALVCFLLPAIGLLIPMHYAIEANRRDTEDGADRQQ